MSNEDAYLMDVMAAIHDVLERLAPELGDEDHDGADNMSDIAFEIASHLDHSHMLIGGYRRGSY